MTTPKHSVGSLLTFGVNNGYLEGILKGFKLGLITQQEYSNICQCENTKDLADQIRTTSYGDILENEAHPLDIKILREKCTERMVQEFEYLRANSYEPLRTFLEYIRYEYMIDNVVLLISGTLHGKDPDDLREKCHPLGLFDQMASITVDPSINDLYNNILIDTPLAPYIQECLSVEDLNEMNIEIIRNTLYKAYLEDFHSFCMKLGGVTAEVMDRLLKFEADKRSINITLNSFGTELPKDDRAKLYPNLGELYPEGLEKFKRADNEDHVRAAIEPFAIYKKLYNESQTNDEKTLEEAFFEYEVELNKLSFLQQGGFGAFYSYFRLKEQEIRNLTWIGECIKQNQRDKINQFIPLF